MHAGSRMSSVLPKDLDRRLGPDTVHQGALIEAEPLPEPTLAELAESAAGRPLIVLDQVTDPHNVGAILRSAAVFGAAGLVMTRRHSPPLDGALAKSASGALEHVPVALVQNLARDHCRSEGPRTSPSSASTAMQPSGSRMQPGPSAWPWCWAPRAKACAS